MGTLWFVLAALAVALAFHALSRLFSSRAWAWEGALGAHGARLRTLGPCVFVMPVQYTPAFARRTHASTQDRLQDPRGRAAGQRDPRAAERAPPALCAAWSQGDHVGRAARGDPGGARGGGGPAQEQAAGGRRLSEARHA